MILCEVAESLVKWIGETAEKESPFLTPYPQWTVDAHALLDKISKLTGVSKEQIEQWIEEAT